MKARTVHARLLAALLALAMVRTGRASPGDVTTLPAPVLGADAPKAQSLHEGDASVATQTGALDYSYPIDVPPGRLGNQPHLALSYSSQAPLFGGIAAGWSMSIPQIRVDTSVSLLQQDFLDGTKPDPWIDQRFISTMAGSRPLARVTEPTSAGVYATFRAQNDGSFTRYERMQAGQPFAWRAYGTDGTVYYFGDTNLSTGGTFGDLAPLTRTVDPFGNTVEYQWDTTSGAEPRIVEIRYTSNPGAGLAAFAKVDFTWVAQAACAGVDTPAGAANDFRSGTQHFFGTNKLTQITATAIDPASGSVQHTRQISLTYSAESESCTAKHGPVRLLTGIQESAWGPSAPRVDLPVVTLSYGETANSPTVTTTTSGWHDDASLTWGYRYYDSRWPTVEAMMLDFDGDGLPDRLHMVNPGSKDCRFTWDKNTGSGFTTGGTLSLPVLGWGPTGTNPALEGCSLDGQLTLIHDDVTGTSCDDGITSGTYLAYRWLDMNGDGLPDLVTAIHRDPNGYDPGTDPNLPWQWPACSGSTAGACEIPDTGCMRSAVSCPAQGLCSVDSTAMESCLGSAQHVPCADVLVGQTQNGTCVNDDAPISSGGCLSEHDNPPGSGECRHPQAAYDRCGGYPWMIYWNQGHGQLASTPDVKYEPIQLETDTGDSSLGGTDRLGQDSAVTDLDGDGYLDGLARLDGPGVTLWWVFRGDGSGQLQPVAPGAGHGWWWYAPLYGAPGGYTDVAPHNQTSCAPASSAEGWTQLADMNGDGLEDLVYQWRPKDGTTPGPVQVFYNEGNQFRFGPQIGNSFMSTPSLLSTIRRTALSDISIAQEFPWVVNDSRAQCWVYGGTRVDDVRMMDIDGDGRQDMFDDTAPGGSGPQLYFNGGGEMLSPTSAAATDPGQRRGTMTLQGSTNGPFLWSHTADFIDLDGDGVPEYVSVAPGGQGAPVQLTATRRSDTAHPMRLLKSIDNGRGAVTTVAYTPLSDSSTVSPTPAPEHAVPRTEWVVKSLTTTDQFASVASTSSYHYDAAHWSQDDVGRWGFRGFDTVHTTSPRGAVTEDRYDYSVDWSGRLRTSLVYPAETPSAPTSVSDTDVVPEMLFGGAITVYEPATVRTWTCGAGKTESQCRTTPAGFTKTVSTWNPLTSTTASGGPMLLYVESVHTLQASESPADGDRSTTTTYALDADGSTYRLRATDALSQVQSGGAPTMFAHTRTDYDPAYLVELRTTQWVDPVDADAAVSERQYDMTTGNVTAKREPEQYAANKNAFTTYTYDAKKLFVATTLDPLGHHSIGTVYDYGTGALLRTIGPNYCSGYCTSGAQAQEKRTDVDGLGRPIATWVAIDATTAGQYTLAKVSTTSYVDSAVSGVATSVTTQDLIEYDDTRWTKEKAELDGHGRPFRKTTYAQGTAPADAISTFTYDAIGKLSQAMVPDASVNSAATVAFTYGFDSTGRPTSMRRPGAVGAQSGVDVTYDGLTETRTETAGSAGGSAATTQLVHDSFGRLVKVNETLAGGALATTVYAYDANDDIDQITDPDALITYLDHDLASRRIAIRRGTRTWSFTYDRNGNVVSETAPPPSNSSADILAYTTTNAYDDDDRIKSRVVGSRWMSSADQDLFGAGELDYTYDTGINGNDRVDQVVTHSTTATPRTVLTSTLGYDAEGNQTSDQRAFNFAGVIKTFSHAQTYAPFGKARLTTYADGVSPNQSSQSRIFYDNRALPSKAQLMAPGHTTQTLGVQTRNVAGLVTLRESVVSSATYDQTWRYDNIGRVAETDVKKNGPLWAVQQLTYFGLDDPATMVQQYTAAAVGGTGINKSFSYVYDTRHQLSQVHENGNAFTGAYTFKSSGRFDRVTVGAAALSGSDVKPRDVYYEYNATDPEAVSRLRNASDGTSFATYQYDTAGNLTSRTYASPAATWSFVYDGEDQLRRATQSGVGTEEYFYDHTGARVGIVKRNASNAITEVRYFHGGDTEVWLSPGGATTAAYAYVSMGTPIARGTNESDLDLEFYSPLSNLLLTIEGASTHPGIASSAFVYGPYGELVQTYQGWSPCGTVASVPCHRRRFNDKYVDELDSLSYYGARYYDPISLTWTQPDPAYRFTKDNAWDQPRRANLYDFDLDNPISFVDPDGRSVWGWIENRAADAVELGGAVAGGIVGTVSGAVVGTAEGGPIGGIYGGYAGAVGGAALGGGIANYPASWIRGDAPTVNSMLNASARSATGEMAGPLLAKTVGPIVAKVSSVLRDSVAWDTQGIGARADEINGVLHPRAQEGRTTAVLRTDGGDIVASGVRDLEPLQRQMLTVGEIAAKLVGAHAEMTALQHAAGAGMTPQAMAVTRAICPACAIAIEASGGKLMNANTAIWPQAAPVPK